MKYLVTGSEGPGFTSPEQAVEVLESGILPCLASTSFSSSLGGSTVASPADAFQCFGLLPQQSRQFPQYRPRAAQRG
jgi:hypothetical protein